MSGKGLGEFGRIRRFLAPLAAGFDGAAGLTDDGALIAPLSGKALAVTTDTMVERIHFLGHETPGDIARKLMRVNLSDLAGMGARARAYTLSLALPARCDDDWVRRFAEGLGHDQARYDTVLIGGDSVSTDGPIVLSLALFGDVDPGAVLRRNGAEDGDDLYVSGSVGDGALGLMAARGLLALDDPAGRERLALRYRLPEPRVALGAALAGVAHAAMDVSDGLVGDCAHLAEASGLAATIEAPRVPLSDAAREAVAADPDLMATVLAGGDDYELLFTAAPGKAAAIAALAEATATPVARIGRMAPGAGVRVVDADGRDVPLAHAGWEH